LEPARQMGAAHGLARGASFLSIRLVDREREILVVDFLPSAVFDDGGQRSVQALAQFIIFLAQSDSGAEAEIFWIGIGITNERAAGAVIGFQPFVEYDGIGQDEVDATCGEIEIGLILRRIKANVGLGVTRLPGNWRGSWLTARRSSFRPRPRAMCRRYPNLRA
jgi:hypothetical protein